MYTVKRRQRHADLAAMLVLSAFEPAWVSPFEVGERLGVAYRPLAFAFRRLVERGLAVERVVTYRGTARSREERREYRLADAAPVSNPYIPVPLPKRVQGRIVRGRFSLHVRWGCSPDRARAVGE